MKESIRLFVAAMIPAICKEILLKELDAFQDPAIRFVPEKNLHLTLYFIGNVTSDKLPTIKQTIQQVALQHRKFTLELEKLEPGPNSKSPRLIWARFKPQPDFELVSRSLTEALAADMPKAQKAIPHVTLARFRKDKFTPPHLSSVVPPNPLQLPIDAVSLWKSELASPHPVYSVLESYALNPT